MKSKKILGIASIAIGIGVILIIVGSFLGAKRSLVVTNEGVKAVGSSIEDMTSTVETDLEEFSSIDVTAYSQNVSIMNSDNGKYGIDIVYSLGGEIEWSIENKTLIVKEKRETVFSFINFDFGFWGREKNKHVIIYVPQGVKMNDIEVDLSSGRVETKDITSNNISYDITSGKGVIDNCTALSLNVTMSSGRVNIDNSAFDNSNIRVTSGKVLADKMNCKKTDINVTSGTAEILGELVGKTKVKTISGTVKLDIIGESTEYSKSAKITSGNVVIDGEKVVSGYEYRGNNENSVDVSATSGKIVMNFIK